MNKVIVELGKVNKRVKLKFGLILNSEHPNPSLRTINKFNIQGNKYIKFAPYPSITIEIDSETDKDRMWSKDKSITLNKMNRFYFVKRLKPLISAFKSREYGLFEIETSPSGEKRLVVNNKKANQCKIPITLPTSSALFTPCVVYDEDNNESEYEGVLFSLNNNKYSCYMTFEEFEYMVNYIESINMDELAFDIINTVLLLNKMNPAIDNIEKRIEENILLKTQPKVNNQASIPDYI